MTRKRKAVPKETQEEVNSYVDLTKKYRPNNIDEFFGNSVLKKSLAQQIKNKQIPQQILFYGDKGCGKTTLARICAKMLNCSEFDLREIDTADFRGIDTVREIRRTMGTKPMKGNTKVYILDEIHMLGRGGDSSKNEAQNSLLKALEEPPKHVYFFLCTTNPENLISTVKSRCVQYKVSPLAPKQMMNLLNYICEQEGTSISKEVNTQITKDVQGSPRDAIKILQKIIHLDEEDQLKAAQQAAKKEEITFNLCRALISKRPWKEIADMLKNLTEEPESSRRIIRKYFATVLLNGNTEAFIVLDSLKQPLYSTDADNELVRCVFEAYTDLTS